MLALVASAVFAAPVIAIENVSIIHPGQPATIAAQTVVTSGDKIVSVGDSRTARVPKGAQRIDGTGKFLIPGLWDMHIHMLDKKNLSLFTANGVTGVRIMFGSPGNLIIKKAAEKGEFVSPRLICGSPIVDGPKPVWGGSIAVANAEEGREAVRKIKKDGYDFVKVYSLLSRESYFAIADECKKQNIPFAGHVPYSVGLIEAMNAGQLTSEHAIGIGIECSSDADNLRKTIAEATPRGLADTSKVAKELAPRAKATFDEKRFREMIGAFKRGKMWHSPTLVVLRNISMLDDPSFQKDPNLKYMPLMMRGMWDPKNDFRFKSRTPEDWQNARKNYADTRAAVREMIKAKAPMLAGTDCLNPYVYAGFSLHEELALLVELGMTPTDALACATINPAKMLGIEKTSGDIKVGMRADLVLLSANPLENIANTKAIAAVVQRGRLFAKAELEKLKKDNEYP